MHHPEANTLANAAGNQPRGDVHAFFMFINSGAI
jgi:hypothetical protein